MPCHHHPSIARNASMYPFSVHRIMEAEHTSRKLLKRRKTLPQKVFNEGEHMRGGFQRLKSLGYTKILLSDA